MTPELDARQERRLREALEGLQGAVPPVPARLPESLLAEVRRGHGLPEPRKTWGLVVAQAVVVFRGGTLPALVTLVALTFLAAAGADNEYGLLVVTAVLPMVAALSLALLSGRAFDPAHDLIASSRTPVGAVVFARTTLMLAATVVLGLAGSVVLASFGAAPLLGTVAAWLGPTVVIASFATLLAQRLSLVLVTVATVSAWGGVVGWIFLELQGHVPFGFGTRSVLQPEPAMFVAQLLLGGALLVLAWRAAVASKSRRWAA